MTDNKNIGLKTQIRSIFLPEEATVLDLFCGYGEMYRQIYKNKAIYYLGIDSKKIHNENCCIIADNLSYVKNHNIDIFNTFDLDAYGSPWKLLFLILSKSPQKNLTVFITDGLLLSLKRANRATKFVSAIEMIPQEMKIPLISRYYPDIFNTMLRYVCQRYSWYVTSAKYAYNTDATVCYWVLKLSKAKTENHDEHISDIPAQG